MSLEDITIGLVAARQAEFAAQLAPRIEQWGELWQQVLAQPLTEEDFKRP